VAIFRDEERGCVGSSRVAAAGACRRRSSSCTSSRGRGSPTPERRSGSSPASLGYVARRDRRRGAGGARGDDADGVRDDALVKAAGRSCASRRRAAIDDAVLHGRAESRPSPARVNVIPRRVRSRDRLRAPRPASAATGCRSPRRSGSSRPTGRARAMARGCVACREEFETQGCRSSSCRRGGHDAGMLARAGVPSGMLFVRSLNGGVSHSPTSSPPRRTSSSRSTSSTATTSPLSGLVDDGRSAPGCRRRGGSCRRGRR
jgi:hypothetical protein